jgi:uncharacterized protein (DUF2252 family)
MTPPRPSSRDELLAIRQKTKMARCAQTFVRGATERFYNWLAEGAHALPEGPSIWICGDCHYGNLGPMANRKGEVAIAIRDLDQTVIGNPAHDVIRLALSLASAARGFDLSGLVTARMIEQIVEGYQEALGPAHGAGEPTPSVVNKLLKASRRRRWDELACERIRDPQPTIPLGKRFWPLSREERRDLTDLALSEPVRELITCLHSRPTGAKVDVLDAAYWVKGCSSLGRLRYAVLVAVDADGERDFGLIDVKEAVKAAAPRSASAEMPRENGDRVVEGARHLAPFLGERMRSGHVLGRSVFVRELLPQDLKLEIGRLDAEEAGAIARFLAGVVGRAHGRQMSKTDRKVWATELNRNRSKSLDAPSWLWRSVVELMSLHEGGYLDHCRQVARIAA